MGQTEGSTDILVIVQGEIITQNIANDVSIWSAVKVGDECYRGGLNANLNVSHE